MSWLSENYEKALMGVAVVTVAAVGYSIFSGSGDVKPPKTQTPNDQVQLGQRDVLSTALKRFTSVVDIASKKSDGNEVQSFTAFPLYSVKGKKGLQSLNDDFEIHPGMKLKWWRENGLEDYKYSDGPELDADKDGFTNREEFVGKTDPKDAKSHPDFIAKLELIDKSSVPFSMSWTKVNDKQGSFTFKSGRNRISYVQCSAGDKLPLKIEKKYRKFEKYNNLLGRFDILEKKVDPDKTGEQAEYYIIQVNDKNKVKKPFRLYYREKYQFKDWKTKLSLNIKGLDTPFEVPEGESFSLPHDPDAEERPYRYLSNRDGGIVIEYQKNGQKTTINLDKKVVTKSLDE